MGFTYKYGDNVDTDVIIPARYLNTSDPDELAKHCMEDIDAQFAGKVAKGDFIVANKFRLRFIQRARAYRHQGFRREMCHRRIVCPDLLPQLHQYRPSYHGMSGSCRKESMPEMISMWIS